MNWYKSWYSRKQKKKKEEIRKKHVYIKYLFGKSNFNFFFPSYKEPIILNPLNFILFHRCKVEIEIPRQKKKKKNV